MPNKRRLTKLCKLSHTPETKDERRVRLNARKVRQLTRTSSLVVMTTQERGEYRRARYRAYSRAMTAFYAAATVGGEPGIRPPPFDPRDGILAVSKYPARVAANG